MSSISNEIQSDGTAVTKSASTKEASGGCHARPVGCSSFIGHLPISECYFAGKGHAGFQPSEGCIVILHMPTGDIWFLAVFGVGSRSLHLTRIVDGANVTPRMEAQVRGLHEEARRLCGGGLSPTHQGSGIVAKDESGSWAVSSSKCLPDGSLRRCLDSQTPNTSQLQDQYQHLPTPESETPCPE
jgi:hypothetical protein